MSNLHEQVESRILVAETDLYRELGARAYIHNGRLILKKAGPSPDDDDNGRRVFAFLLPKLRKAICEDWSACSRLDKFPDETALAVAISDTLFTAKIAPLPGATLAVLTVRIGIKKFCACD